MRKFVRTTEALVGKTIESQFEIDNELVLTFTDGTYTAIQSAAGYDGERETPELTEIELYYESQLDRMVKHGFITNDEAIAWRAKKAEQDRVYQKGAEERERREFERLKAKFG